MNDAGIETQHRIIPGCEWLAKITEAERIRRANEHFGEMPLEEFERMYFGIEVGNIRRYFEQRMMRWIPKDCGAFIDYGCGGTWWKQYWQIPKQVIGIEIDESNLLRLRKAFPDRLRYRLIHAPTGLTTLPDASADVILSSGVLGFILPSQAELHVAEIARMLKPGGRAVFSRVNAMNYGTIRRLSKLTESAKGGFAYQYTRRELRSLMEKAGFQVAAAERLGFYLPFQTRSQQWAYRSKTVQELDRIFHRLVPGFAVHHLMVAQKPQN